MSIEREIELASGQANTVSWQAYGLPEMTLQVPPTVYPPREDTVLLDRVLSRFGPGRGRHLLEIGSGSGAIAIAAAIRGWRVSTCDIHPFAVAATRGNAVAHGYEANVVVAEGGPGEGSNWKPSTGADVIAWNLPYLEPTEERLGPLEDAALIGSDESTRLLEVLAEDAALLRPGGIVLLLHSSNRMGDEIPSAWRGQGWATRVQRTTVVGDERLTVVAAWRPFENSIQEVVQVCESTNSQILDFEHEIGYMLRTESQPHGRGQHGRGWVDSPHGFMGSWNLSPDSISTGADHLQRAASIAVLDVLASVLELGLPSHSWAHCASLENLGLRLKWPNDIWLRTDAGHAKICGILAEGRTQGQDVRVVLGIGLNATGPGTNLLTAGWNDLVSIDVEQLTPILHASIASLLEVHPLVESIDRSEILATTHAAMRLTFMEGRARGERALGLDEEGRLLLPSGPIDSTEQVDWAWS